MIDLKAKADCCEEASPLSGLYYIPCNAPAVFMVKNRDPQPYRMCAGCADHNVRHRGAKIVGPYPVPAIASADRDDDGGSWRPEDDPQRTADFFESKP